MKKAVIIIGKGFEDSEFIYPFYRLQEANIQVDVAIAGDMPVKGKLGQEATPTIKCEELDANNFDMVIIPGGHEGPDRARQVPQILNFVKDMDTQKKWIATICHGTWVTISAKIMRGKKATCYKGMKDDLENSGCTYMDVDVVVDGHFISSPHFRNNHQWMRALLEQINR